MCRNPGTHLSSAPDPANRIHTSRPQKKRKVFTRKVFTHVSGTMCRSCLGCEISAAISTTQPTAREAPTTSMMAAVVIAF